ncbi:MAG TPA: hypothetical protein VF493_05410 [Terriglobales bacterium]
MKVLARRAFLRFAGVAAATPAMASVATEAQKASAAGYLMGVPGAAIPQGPSQYEQYNGLGQPIYEMFRREHSANTRAAQERLAWRIDGFDPDISVLRSLPIGTRIRMQKARDAGTQSRLFDLAQKLGWI